MAIPRPATKKLTMTTQSDIATAPLRDCLSYYNGEGNAQPGSLAYYGGPRKWHELRAASQGSLAAYVFGS